MDMAWKKSSDHPDGAPGETRLTFDSAVLCVDWSSSAQCSKILKKLFNFGKTHILIKQ